MPYTISRLDSGKGVLHVGDGTITDEEYSSTMTAHFTEPQDLFGALYYSLVDLTEVEAVNVATETVRKAARLGKANFHRNPRVIIGFAAAADLLYGLSRLWQAEAGDETWTMKAFRSRSEAEEWIRDECRERHALDGLRFM